MSVRESPRDLRVFGLVLAAFHALLAWRWRQPSPTALSDLRALSFGGRALLAFSLVYLVLALAAPRALLVVYRPWMRLAKVLGRVTSTVLLTLVFFGVMTPLGLARRLFGWDPFGVRRPSPGSFWQKRDPSLDEPSRLRRLY
jgi:hypothetical protein